MVRNLCVFLPLVLAAATLFAAEDNWAKLQELKTGIELRVYKKGVSQPMLAQYGDSAEGTLIVIVKNKQSSIPKEEIDRVDYRPSKGKPKVTSTVKTEDPPVTPKTPYESRVPSTSYSTGISSGKPDFETIYQRTPSKPDK